MSSNERSVSVEATVAAEPHEIFDLLCDPAQHAVIDGSGMVQASRESSDTRLRLGSKFSMNMKMGRLPYRITNTVVEFEANHLIAWCHLGRHRWRWELDKTAEGTRVRHTFDWSTALSPALMERLGYPAKNAKAIEQTMARLVDHFAAG